MTKTTNYNLNQWGAEDVVKREDFNADNAAIDAALKTIATTAATALSTANSAASTANSACKIAYGSYAGTGNYGSANANTLTFPFQPKLVLVQLQSYGAVALSDANYGHFNTLLFIRPLAEFRFVNNQYKLFLSWSGNSVSWYSPDSADKQINRINSTYSYLAFG